MGASHPFRHFISGRAHCGLGARPLRRAVEHYLEDPLAEALLRGEVKEHEPILVVRNGDKLEFKTKSPTAESGVSS